MLSKYLFFCWKGLVMISRRKNYTVYNSTIGYTFISLVYFEIFAITMQLSQVAISQLFSPSDFYIRI